MIVLDTTSFGPDTKYDLTVIWDPWYTVHQANKNVVKKWSAQGLGAKDV